MIVIPAIDLRGGRCVRLLRGDPDAQVVYGDDPVAVARRFADAGARMLHVVDLDAALEDGDNRGTLLSICESVSIPVQTGGGLHDMQAVDRVLAMGASRAVLGTVAPRDPRFVRRAVDRLRALDRLGVESTVVGKALYEGTLLLEDALAVEEVA